MDEHLFLKGQRVITPEGEGEVIDAVGDNIEVKLDKGPTQTFSSENIQDNNSAGWNSRLIEWDEKNHYPGCHLFDGNLIE